MGKVATWHPPSWLRARRSLALRRRQKHIMLPMRHDRSRATVPNTTREAVLMALLDTTSRSENYKLFFIIFIF